MFRLGTLAFTRTMMAMLGTEVKPYLRPSTYDGVKRVMLSVSAARIAEASGRLLET